MDSKTTTPLGAALTVRDGGAEHPNRVYATIPPDWAQGRATFGGLLAGLGVRALERLNERRPLRAFSISFCAPAGPGDIAIDLELLRSGRSLLHAQARISQAGQPCAILIGAYGEARPSPVGAEGERAPAVPAPETLERLPFIEGVMPTFTQHFDFRWSSQNVPFSAGKIGQIGGWVRALGVERVDTAVLAAIVDSFPAPILPLMPGPAPSSTATWFVNFVGDPFEAPGDAYWQLDATTISAAGGYANVDAKLWDASGVLRVVSRQLVVEFSAPR